MIARNATIASKMYDEGLRKFMINMYNHTALGLAVSGFIAYLVFTTGMVYSMGGLMWVFMFAPLGMILYYGFAGQNWSLQGITRFYYLFTAVMGGMSTILVYSDEYVQYFLIYKYPAASHTDTLQTSPMGIVGLIGIIIASIVNIASVRICICNRILVCLFL